MTCVFVGLAEMSSPAVADSDGKPALSNAKLERPKPLPDPTQSPKWARPSRSPNRRSVEFERAHSLVLITDKP
jgi:hypothetical protein